MTKKEKIKILKSLIIRAIDELYDKDIYLINNKPQTLEKDGKHYVGERAIVFRFAHYFQNLIDTEGYFAGYNLDCEYNRNGVKVKKLPSFPNGTFPDVILHKRGRIKYDILVMEFKTYWNNNQGNDFEKIREFTDLSGQYKFLYGVTVLIGKTRNEVIIQSFYNGQTHDI